jgi:hypothetical protein
MAEFNIRTDSVDVEQIMRQIRARIKEKRGVDYTEQQIQELANVKLERFLDPKGVRSDLVEQFKRTRGVSPEPPNYSFEDTTIYETHRGILRFFRRLLNPFLKLLFNPNPIVHVLHMQGRINNINTQQFRVREELDALYYEVIHNLVLEVTRLGIESKNLKMRLESLSSRMDFDERRARALEGVVQYRTGTGPSREPQPTRPPANRGRHHTPQPRQSAHEQSRQQAPVTRPVEPLAAAGQPSAPAAGNELPELAEASAASGAEDPNAAAGFGSSGTARRRRRRRRGRRGGRGRSAPLDNAATVGGGTPVPPSSEDLSATPPHGDPTADAALGTRAERDDIIADHGTNSGDSGLTREPGAWDRDDEGPDPEA